jgi:hypothetical protein
MPPDNERLAPADQPAPLPRAEVAERHSALSEEARSRASGDRQPPDQVSDALARFEPERAGLPDVSAVDAARYIETQRADRPWLDSAQHAPADVQHVFAALDQGGGHAHIRHEGWTTAEKSQLRVQYLQDPAQLDPTKKAQGIDGLLPGDKKHYCAAMSTAIRDPTTFAEAFACGTDHPDVRRVLDTTPGGGRKPPPIALPITDLLGPDGHDYCEGYRLVGNDLKQSAQNRETWLRETQAGERPSVSPPLLVPIDFRGGTIQFLFRVNSAKVRYEVSTMFPQPPA